MLLTSFSLLNLNHTYHEKIHHSIINALCRVFGIWSNTSVRRYIECNKRSLAGYLFRAYKQVSCTDTKWLFNRLFFSRYFILQLHIPDNRLYLFIQYFILFIIFGRTVQFCIYTEIKFNLWLCPTWPCRNAAAIC